MSDDANACDGVVTGLPFGVEALKHLGDVLDEWCRRNRGEWWNPPAAVRQLTDDDLRRTLRAGRRLLRFDATRDAQTPAAFAAWLDVRVRFDRQRIGRRLDDDAGVDGRREPTLPARGVALADAAARRFLSRERHALHAAALHGDVPQRADEAATPGRVAWGVVSDWLRRLRPEVHGAALCDTLDPRDLAGRRWPAPRARVGTTFASATSGPPVARMSPDGLLSLTAVKVMNAVRHVRAFATWHESMTRRADAGEPSAVARRDDMGALHEAWLSQQADELRPYVACCVEAADAWHLDPENKQPWRRVVPRMLAGVEVLAPFDADAFDWLDDLMAEAEMRGVGERLIVGTLTAADAAANAGVTVPVAGADAPTPEPAPADAGALTLDDGDPRPGGNLRRGGRVVYVPPQVFHLVRLMLDVAPDAEGRRVADEPALWRRLCDDHARFDKAAEGMKALVSRAVNGSRGSGALHPLGLTLSRAGGKVTLTLDALPRRRGTADDADVPSVRQHAG